MPGVEPARRQPPPADEKQGTSITLIVVGGVLALWTLSGAMQNVMWALNQAYDHEETRGFFRRRIVAGAMAVFALMASALALGLLVLGPSLSAGSATRSATRPSSRSCGGRRSGRS